MGGEPSKWTKNYRTKELALKEKKNMADFTSNMLKGVANLK